MTLGCSGSRVLVSPAPAGLASFLALGLAVVLGLGCATSDPDPRTEPPAEPAANDPAFDVAAMRSWYLMGDGLTPDADVVTAFIHAPDDADRVDAWIAGGPGLRMHAQDGGFALQESIAALPAGEHEILFAKNGETTAFARVTFHRSHALYVLMSTDWDFADPGDGSLHFQDLMHARHPDMKLSMFVGPYTFTDPAVSEARRTALVSWLTTQRDTFGDEIGLHIHPYCNFVTYAGKACITDQSTVYANDATGYTGKVSAYGEADFADLLGVADQLFIDRGLGKPVTFRAGGWTASLETERALASRGYVADSSALNWARLEEWEGQGTGELYRWNMENWAPIGDTSQPYYPSMNAILTGAPPALSILEVPDNGIMVDYVSTAEMKQIFDANFDGTALATPRTVMMGFHPSTTFSQPEFARIEDLLTYADARLASRDAGPVVYAVLKDMPAAFATATGP